MTRLEISKDILKTATPLILSIISYPLFASVSLGVIAACFPDDLSFFILAQTSVTIAVRCCESLLSGTRVLTAQKIHESLGVRRKILGTALMIGLGLALCTAFLALGFWGINGWLIENAYCQKLSYAILCLVLGLPGNFAYNACAYFLHAHKHTYFLPCVSWTANILGGGLMYLYGATTGASFYVCLFIASLSRNVLGILAFWSVPSDWKTLTFFKHKYTFLDAREILKFGVSYALYSILFAGSYFLFALILELDAGSVLPTFQIQMNLLNIFTVVNISVASSGCILLTHTPVKQIQLRQKIVSQNFILNTGIVVALWSTLFLFQKDILFWMGKQEVSLSLFRQTFFVLLGIYGFDLTQTILTQIMTYNNDYLVPPLLRMSVFASLALPLAWVIVHIYHMSLTGLLWVILLGTVVSSSFTVRRFYQSRSLFSLNHPRNCEA